MPCQDWDRPSDDGLAKRCDDLADLLCTLCAHVEQSGNPLVSSWPTKVRLWWEHHKQLDAQLKADEEEAARKTQLKKEAKAKLSKQEREALGIE